jgi:hypothetical protein
MARSKRWHTAQQWAGIVCWLVCSITAVSAQDGCWKRVTAAGVQASSKVTTPPRYGSSRRRSPGRMPGAWCPVS